MLVNIGSSISYLGALGGAGLIALEAEGFRFCLNWACSLGLQWPSGPQ